jgi:hypothetical protein
MRARQHAHRKPLENKPGASSAVTPTPIVYTIIAAVKTLVVGPTTRNGEADRRGRPLALASPEGVKCSGARGGRANVPATPPNRYCEESRAFKARTTRVETRIHQHGITHVPLMNKSSVAVLDRSALVSPVAGRRRAVPIGTARGYSYSAREG